MTTATDRLDAIVLTFLADGTFRPEIVDLDEDTLPHLVKFNGNPIRFLPKMFDGHWEILGVHPGIGPSRVLRVVVDNQEVSRVIVRQETALFIYTAVPPER